MNKTVLVDDQDLTIKMPLPVLPFNNTHVRMVALFNVVASLCLFLPGSTVYVVPIILFVMFILALMLFALDDFIASFASLATTGILIWYFVLIFTNRSIIDTMPENWNTANRLIASIAAVHCLFITFGKSFYQLTWVTMAGMVALLTMQHVVATNFRTNG